MSAYPRGWVALLELRSYESLSRDDAIAITMRAESCSHVAAVRLLDRMERAGVIESTTKGEVVARDPWRAA